MEIASINAPAYFLGHVATAGTTFPLAPTVLYSYSVCFQSFAAVLGYSADINLIIFKWFLSRS
jgi:hypothetical protein